MKIHNSSGSMSFGYSNVMDYPRHLLKERNNLLANGRRKDYFCKVVSEDVEITLVNKRVIGMKYKKNLFVRCNQPDCQYVEINEDPCPLTLDLFVDEIERREKRAGKDKLKKCIKRDNPLSLYYMVNFLRFNAESE